MLEFQVDRLGQCRPRFGNRDNSCQFVLISDRRLQPSVGCVDGSTFEIFCLTERSVRLFTHSEQFLCCEQELTYLSSSFLMADFPCEGGDLITTDLVAKSVDSFSKLR